MSLPIHTIYCLPDRPEEYRDPRKSRAFRNLQAYAGGREVVLWDYAEVQDFSMRHDADLWHDLQRVPRGIMMVDVLRWLLVYRLGGMYFQLGTAPLVPMDAFSPTAGHSARVFTEFVLTPEQCRAAMRFPIREGRPEEPVRVLNQVFSAEKESPFIGRMLEFLVRRLRTLTPREDYDVLYIAANGGVSEGYDRFGKQDASVELTSLEDTRRMLKLTYAGLWRTDPDWVAKQKTAKPAVVETFGPLPRTPFRDFAKSIVSHRLRPHPHEQLFRLLLEEGRLDVALAVPDDFLKKKGIRRVFSAPFAAKNKSTFVNLLYDRISRGDLLLLPDVLEWLPDAEIRRIWSRILQSGCRYLATTHCPLLDRHWDTALGDFRPLNLCLPPFGLSEPCAVFSAPRADRRADRRLAVWPLSTL